MWKEEETEVPGRCPRAFQHTLIDVFQQREQLWVQHSGCGHARLWFPLHTQQTSSSGWIHLKSWHELPAPPKRSRRLRILGLLVCFHLWCSGTITVTAATCHFLSPHPPRLMLKHSVGSGVRRHTVSHTQISCSRRDPSQRLRAQRCVANPFWKLVLASPLKSSCWVQSFWPRRREPDWP